MVYIARSLVITIGVLNLKTILLLYAKLSWLFNDQSCMPKMSPSAVLLATNYFNALFQKAIKALLWIFLINVPVPFDKSFQLNEELFNWIKIG